MLQCRARPYRTHFLLRDKTHTTLGPGRYCGRVLDVAIDQRIDVAINQGLDVAINQGLDVAINQGLDIAINQKIDQGNDFAINQKINPQNATQISKHSSQMSEVGLQVDTSSDLTPAPFPLAQAAPSQRLLTIWMEDQQFRFLSSLEPVVEIGSLIAFEVISSERIVIHEILHKPILRGASLSGDIQRWRRLDQPISRFSLLKKRHLLLKATRAYFDQADFLEVNTPLVVPTPNPEHQFHYFQTQTAYLITSPEFHLKRMLVGGFEKIYQLASCFRQKEAGKAHNPEFTMLEWYRAYARLEEVVQDCETLLVRLLTSLQDEAPGSKPLLRYQGRQIDCSAPWARQSLRDLFAFYTQIDLKLAADAHSLYELAQAEGFHDLPDPNTSTYEEIFFQLFTRFESSLGWDRPVWVYDWPLALSSLAQERSDCPGFVERVELYIAGMEVANGFGELTNAALQRERLQAEIELRRRLHSPQVGLDEDFLQSLAQGLPPSAGMALGYERLLMLCLDTQQILDVLPFAWHER